MSFDGTDAALAALQTQDSSTSLRHLADADQAGHMLDAAMLAGPGTAAPPETQAVMAAPAEEAGDVLVASLMETLAAPPGAEAPAQTETNPEPVEYDLTSMEIVLPEAEEFFVDNVTNQSSGQTIIVTGTRVRLYFVPSEPVSEPPVQGDTTVIEPIEAPANPDAGYYVYEIIALNLKLRMPEAEYNALSQTQKNALFHVLENHHKSTDLTAALQHYKNEGVEVVIRYGTQSWNAKNGLSYDFARDTIAGMSTDWLNDDRTNLRAGSPAIISFNSNHSMSHTFDGFGSTLVHELLHPYVPNTLQRIGDEEIWSDHDRVDCMTDVVWARIGAP